jgi:NADPH2:quinone reductase
MKAIRMHAIGGPEVLHLDEVDTPEPGPGQVLIKVEAAGVAYGDIMKRQGGFVMRTQHLGRGGVRWSS